MALNIAAPTRSPMPAMDATIRSPSRSRGTIGSAARRSTRTSHQPKPTAAPPASAAHAPRPATPVWPTASSSSVTDVISRAAPA